MHEDFDGLDAVITGGTGALGSAVVGLLLARGARCVVPCLHLKELDRFPHRDHERVRIVEGADLTDEAGVVRLYAGVTSLWASVHVAGGFAMAGLADTSLADFRAMFNMNAVTCFLCAREAVKRIRASGGRGGRIVNVAAKPAIIPAGGMVAYSTSKAAVASLTLCLAEELRDEGIFVNAVVPSIMDTAANRRAMPDADHAKWPSVDSVAEAIAHLASPTNKAVRGGLVPVYGRS